VDIGQSLFTDGGRGTAASDSDGEHEITHNAAGTNDGMDFMASETETSDDENAIAKQLAASQRKATNLKGKSVKKGGGFQAMGLNANLLKAITRKGFSVPTPIQRKTIPLLLNDKDVVGMARTGSGKTAAFVIPMIEKLKAHSPKVGARALIMSPSRELALQTLSVVKELGKGTDLRSVLLVGGDSLEEQFSAMASNPDIVIATPGRFLHLKVEMNLDLQSIRYAVFDEADRLFEMGFAAQLTEILYALPSSRQTLLFSATLPKSLVEFARAGLQEPSLIRLDADSKVSPDLQSAFFTVKSSEKEGALLHLLQDVIGVPTGSQLLSAEGEQKGSKKRKRSENEGSTKGVSNEHSTIVFAATKHHVEYLANLLKAAGYAVSYVYGSLDQTARKEQVQAFRSHQSNILVVTDVAARGIDIPILANVINYDFPSQPKIYVHRVGRTARAGQKGWSYSFVRDADAPYLLDLQLFLGRKLIVGRSAGSNFDLATDVVVGSQRRDAMQAQTEWATNTLQTDVDLAALRTVASKGEKLYQRTRNSASSESAKRAKQLVGNDSWTELHPMFDNENDGLEAARQAMLARVGGFRPQESIFEIGARRGGRKNNEEAVDAIRTIRNTLEVKKRKSQAAKAFEYQNANKETLPNELSEDDRENGLPEPNDMSDASDSELEVTFSTGEKKPDSSTTKQDPTSKNSFQNNEYFMSYAPEGNDLDEERAYGVHSGSNTNFVEAARGATMDLAGDEGAKNFGEARSVMRWDKRHKKYVSRNNDEDGSKGSKLVRGESGAKIAASFRSGRFDAWKKANRVGRALRVGEKEREGVGAVQSGSRMGNKRFKHSKMDAPKAADKFRDDFETRKKKVAAAKEREQANTGNKRELHSVDDIRKARNLKQKRQEKNARPQRKGKR
jgi:ATP-dependent RNA helicase DDX54/DBP10